MNNTEENQTMSDKLKEVSEILKKVDEKEKTDTLIEYIRNNEQYKEEMHSYSRWFGQGYKKYENVAQYIELLPDLDSRIKVAQELGNFELAKELIQQYPFNDEELKKLKQLESNNAHLELALRPKILSSTYDFLNDQLDYLIAANADNIVLNRILELSSDELVFFKNCFGQAKENGIFMLRFLRNFPHIVEKFESLGIQSINENTDEKLISNFLWICGNSINVPQRRTSHWDFMNKISSIDDIRNLEDIVKEQCNNDINNEKLKDNKNINVIRNALLMSTYGMSALMAKNILDQYNIKGMQMNKENESIMLMYYNLLSICNETNPDRLIKIYEEYTRENPVKFSFLTPDVFEKQLLNMFAKELNNSYLKVDDLIEVENDSKLHIYNAGTEFKICLTAIGAYQKDFRNQKNYKEYWNSREINNHLVSCSLVANNNLATAKITNICLGFTDFNENMLYAGGPLDLASDTSYGHLYEAQLGTKLSTGDNMINETRGQYNELLYERRDLSNGEYYKKNPDYIVYFEEFEEENIETLKDEEIQSEPDEEKRKILQEQKRMWEETVKASKDFGKDNEDGELKPLPIVKVNREECAKSENAKIEKAFKEYIETNNPELLSIIITNYQNNRNGTHEHKYIQDKYFSGDRLRSILDEVVSSIMSINDAELRRTNIQSITNLLKQEKVNIELNCNEHACGDEAQLLLISSRMGINPNEYLNKINELNIDINSDKFER